MRKIKLLLFIIVGILAVSCDKKNESDLKMGNGLILNYGNPAADGCGWIVEINKVFYSPENLDATFQKDSLKVTVDYQILNSYFGCGFANHGYQQIRITSIKEQ